MGKRSQSRPVQYEKDPSGCMRGLISIFDFRHGRTSQKLLSDRRRGGRRASGAANRRNKRDKLIHLDENCRGIPGGEVSTKPVADANKPMEEAMFSGQPNQKILDLKEKMEMMIKLFITQKIISVKHIAEDGDVHLPENLINVLQILCADDELFLKLVQDPSSILINYGQWMQNASVEKGEDSKSLAGPQVSDHGPRNLKQCDELVKHKQHNLFRRKVKSMESPQSKGSKISPQASNTIIILKPGTQNSETDSSIGSSVDSHSIAKNKGPSERIGSHFFITEFKRKLKHAMGKERPEISTDDVLRRTSYESHHLGANDKGTKENVGTSSPSKDHFFIERITKPPTGVKKEDKISKLKHRETDVENEAASFPKQRVSNIYVEAKKYLSDMLNNGDEHVVSSSRLVPKTLGRILSLPVYNTSPFGSPGRDREHGFMTAQMRLSNSEKCQTHENSFSNMGLLTQNLEARSSICNSNNDNEVQHPNPNVENLSVVVNEAEETIFSVKDKMTCKADEISKLAETVVDEEMNSLGTHPEPSISTDFTRDALVGDIFEVCDEQKDSECLNQEACEGNEQPFTPLASPSNASITETVEDPETIVYIPEQPSPVSVLEPLFSEDDISPASTKSKSELPVQPLRIQFEEGDSSSAEGIRMKTYIDDKEQIIEYIRAVLQASDLKWDEVYLMSSSSEQLLDPLLFQELDFFSDQLCRDKKLLFDCINEVLVTLYQPYFGCFPWSSFVKLSVRPVHEMKNATLEVWEEVNWHLIPLPLPHTLDQIVKKDMAKTGTWMDLRFDTESIVSEISELIFEELMKDTVLSCINGSSEIGELLLLDERNENFDAILLERQTNNVSVYK